MTVLPSTQSIDLRLLIAGIEELDAGFTVFDADLRLIAANARFRQMLGFSEVLCQPGAPFSAFLRDNAERGEYGEGDVEDLVATRLALARQFLPHRFERVRPDGGVIDVRGRPLPGGGIVTIYTDVTEQRRREQALKDLTEQLEQRVLARTSELQQREAELAQEKGRLELVLNTIPMGISLFDSNLNLELSNQQLQDIMRFPSELCQPGMPFERFIRHNAERGEYGVGDVEPQIRSRVEMAWERKPHRFERIRPDGSAVEVIGCPTSTGGFVTTYLDVSDRVRAEAALRASEAQLRTILEASPIGIAVVDAENNTVLFCNPRLAEQLGQTPDELIGCNARRFFVDKGPGVTPWGQRSGDAAGDTERQLQRSDGSSWRALVSIKPLAYLGKSCLLIWAYDISELHEAREQLDRLAHHDALTTLPNRRYFDIAAERAITRAKRFNSRGLVFYFDLDGFKLVNDSLGHAMGDRDAAKNRHESSCSVPGV